MCLSVCLHIPVFVHVSVCVCMYLCVCLCIPIFVYVCVYVCLCLCMCLCVCLCLCVACCLKLGTNASRQATEAAAWLVECLSNMHKALGSVTTIILIGWCSPQEEKAGGTKIRGHPQLYTGFEVILGYKRFYLKTRTYKYDLNQLGIYFSFFPRSKEMVA